MEQQNESLQSAKTAIKQSEDFFADFNFSGVDLSLETMLKSGVHFGHQKARKHPKMSEYVFGSRKGICIIDLEKTKEKLEQAMEFVAKLRHEGKMILVVSAKKQNRDLIISFAKRFNLPFVVERWLGGTFTNFSVIRKRADYLKKSQEMLDKGEFKKYTKFEQMKKAEELDKLEKKMGGIKEMIQLPGAVLVTDLREDDLAVKESIQLKIPVIAIADTNVDPSVADYPIPGNDDAISSLRYVLACLGKALLEAPEEKKVS